MLTASMVDERRELDKCVTAFRSLVRGQLDIGMIMVSHLTVPAAEAMKMVLLSASVSCGLATRWHNSPTQPSAYRKTPKTRTSDVRFVSGC